MQVQTILPVADYSPVALQRAEIRKKVAEAAIVIAPVWPLRTFIARNPLQGLESLPFEKAIAEGARLFQHTPASPELESVNRQLIKWCHAYLDEGQATLVMPGREKGFYCAWKELALFDDQVHQGRKEHKRWLATLPDDPADALIRCLNTLNVPNRNHEAFLSQSLTYLPGWAGYVKWRTDWQPATESTSNPITLIDFLAVRLAITCVLWPQAGRHTPVTSAANNAMAETVAQLEKRETTYRNKLLASLLPHTGRTEQVPPRPDAQLVFCIDVRSEPFRRSLEALGNYETIGFAGFFGLPVRVHDYVSGEAHDACPVLLKPRHEIHDEPIAQELLPRFERGKRALRTLKAFYQDLKYNFATPFALVETLGAACGLLMLGRTLAPVASARSRQGLTQAIQPTLHTKPVVCCSDGMHGIAPDQQAAYAETILRLMGLTDNFGKLVVFCGHGSTTENNPYGSALDCGACGGNHGGPNAQLLAAILNTPSVRNKLAENRIRIPVDTIFLAAEHNTTTDEVMFFNAQSSQHGPLFRKLIDALDLARMENSANRCRTFGQSTEPANSVAITTRRSTDWAEVRPEWGLARNAAFIVGPRQLTQELDLEGRCFLHSYNWEQDANHTTLETILTAPMVVAQWINNQYLFSTLDNVAYGSGSKVTQNVAGKLGVMQGNASDLMHGLPLQSVMASDETAYHEPQRLLTVVYAPRYRVELLTKRQDVLQKLFYNGWVTLVAIEPTENRAYQLDCNGEWRPLGVTYDSAVA